MPSGAKSSRSWWRGRLQPRSRPFMVEADGKAMMFQGDPRSSPKKPKARGAGLLRFLAGGRGFEPRLPESKSDVLPLDDPPPKRSRVAYTNANGSGAGTGQPK